VVYEELLHADDFVLAGFGGGEVTSFGSLHFHFDVDAGLRSLDVKSGVIRLRTELDRGTLP
jgi:hypothetical protein